jgi:DNA-binding response OmpR family regulator
VLARKKAALLPDFHLFPAPARQDLPGPDDRGWPNRATIGESSRIPMPSAKHVLLVDGNALLRASLAEQLEREGSFVVVEAGSSSEALAATGEFALAIIDAQLPDSGGESLAAALRQAGFTSPILLLGGEDAEPSGAASEVIAKPFRFAHLLARLNAHASRHPAHDQTPIRIGPYLFRPGAKLLIEGTRKVRLTEKEADILKFLAAASATVPRETLLHEVWGYNPAVTTHTLETHIYRLRRKIEANPGKAEILLTEEGGYRLTGFGP